MVQSRLRLERAATRDLSTRRVLVIGAIALLAPMTVLVAACGDDSSSIRSTGSSSSSSSGPAPPNGGGTSLTIGIVCSTPTDAAMALVSAWTAGDRAAAARCASPEVVAELFMADGANARWTFTGCGGPDPGVPVCRYTYAGGSARLTIEGTEARGWKVTKLDR